MNLRLIISLVILLASVAGSIVVLACLDFLRPPGRRPRVDHAMPHPSPLKGLARERVKSRSLTLRSLGAVLRGLRSEGRL